MPSAKRITYNAHYPEDCHQACEWGLLSLPLCRWGNRRPIEVILLVHSHRGLGPKWGTRTRTGHRL